MTVIIEGILQDSGDTTPVTRPTFSTIASMLRSLPPRGVGVVWGNTIQEEISHYATGLGLHPSHGSIVNSRYYSVRSEAARLSRQYARRRYKVESFLWRSMPAAPSLRVSQETTLDFADIFDFAAAATWQQIVQFLKPRYIATRRVRDDVDDDIQNYLLPFRTANLQGDIVTKWSSSGPTYEDLILLWMFYHSQGNVRLVIATDAKPRWITSPSIIASAERQYVDVDDLISSISSYFHRPTKTIHEALGLWQRGTNASIRALIKEGRITETQADAFLRAYAPLVTEDEDDHANLGIIVPSQQPAPLRFKTVDNRIDVIDDKELKPSEARVVGAASACISALDDLETYTGFENAIPTFRSKAARIRTSLEKLRSGDYDDNSVVQLGLETALFETRIANASEMLSDIALAESSSFFPLVQGLLHQFSIWASYRAKELDPNITQDASQAALDVLGSTGLGGEVLTARAKLRVDDYISGVVEPDVAAGDTGAAAVVENMAAQAASAIAQASHDSGKPISPALAESLRQTGTSAPASWMLDNAGDLKTFAESGKVSWLMTFLGALNRRS